MNGLTANAPQPNSLATSETAADAIRLEGFGPQDLYQRREKIFTRYVGGIFQKLRFYTGWPLFFGYFALPWITLGERQAVLFDLPARQFHLFGLTIWPQDLWLLGWLLMIAAFGLFTVTTIVGRLWCGYTCPQTVWTAIFMWIEQVTEGARHQRIRLEAAPWSFTKLRKRVSKHTLWLGWAFLTALTFVGYFTPIRELTTAILSSTLMVYDDTAAMSGWVLFWIAFFTAATYINAGWLREQVCLYMCPYARFQSAMIDQDTLIVSYDAGRGEPRGSRKRATRDNNLGDCINCQLCVQVCPTGIDIRDGLQYQCIGCAHCIDACAQVMDKMNYAPGLIRYTTHRALNSGTVRLLRSRSVGYAAACAVLIAAFVFALFTRSPLAFDVIRERGDLYVITANGEVRNDYQLKLMNKTQSQHHYSIRVVEPADVRLSSSADAVLAGGAISNLPLQLTAGSSGPSNQAVLMEICSIAGQHCVSETTRFLRPGNNQ